MDIKVILDELAVLNVRLYAEDENIKLVGLRENIKPETIAAIKENKGSLLSYLRSIESLPAAIRNIPCADHRESYPVSSVQRRLWVLSRSEAGNTAYNVGRTFVFEGKMDRELLERCFQELIGRHEILRTVFREDNLGEVRQFVLDGKEVSFHVEYRDMRGGREEQVRARVQEELARPFDLSSGPLLRAVLLEVGDGKYVFTYVMHHIISDAWSTGILIRELLSLYNGGVRGEAVLLAPLRVQYRDYASWQQEQLGGTGFQAAREYWLEQFSGEVPVLELLGDRVRPGVKTYRGGAIERRLGAGTGRGLRGLLQAERVTLFMGLLAAVNVLLYRYTGQEDIVVGSPIAGREHPDLEGQLGCYLNTLALRCRLGGGESYRELLGRVREVTLGAYAHQSYPFDELVDELRLRRDMSRNPLFDVLINVSPVGIIGSTPEFGDIRVSEFVDREREISKFDLSFIFVELGEELRIGIEYNSDIYDRDTVERMGDHLTGLLGAIVECPDKPIGQLEYLSAAERHQLLTTFNARYASNSGTGNLFG